MKNPIVEIIIKIIAIITIALSIPVIWLCFCKLILLTFEIMERWSI